MGLLGWIVVGFVAGALARPVTGGGWLFSLAGDEGIGDFGLRSMFVAFVGAVLLLAVVALLGGRRDPGARAR